MKKIITCTLLAAAASLAQPVFATPTFNTSGQHGSTGAQTNSTSFVYDKQEPTTALVFTTHVVAGQESAQHGVVADTTFTVPNGVVSAFLEPTYYGANQGKLEASFAADTNPVSVVNNGAKTLTSGETLHILLQNATTGDLNSGPTTVTYNVTTYTD
ncbi:hypothetical protein LE36_16695 [Salmonella enterica subsp. diarizonae]|nr:hypothetical protein [Salmonella enterica subsp. diarizonae]